MRFAAPQVASCAIGLSNREGELLAKEWQLESSSCRLREILRPYRCPGGHTHGDSMGGDTLWRTAVYTPLFAALIAQTLVLQ